MTKYSLYHNGENNYIELPKIFSGVINTFSFEVLVKPLTETNGVVLISRQGSNDKAIVWYGEDKKFGFQIEVEGTKYKVYSDVHDVGKWLHVVGTYDGAKQKIFANGVLENEANLAVDVDWDVNYIGWYVGVNEPGKTYSIYFNGYIGFIRIYNRVLSESEIEQNFENPYEPVSDGLVLWLLMDEGEGDVVYDKSGNGNDGTIYGAEWVRSPVLQWSPVKIGEVIVYPSSVKWSYEGGVRAVRFLGAECGLVYASTGKVEEEVEVEVKNKVSDSFLSDIEMLKSYIGEEVYVKFSYFPVYPMIVSSVEKREETHNMLSVFIKLKPVM